MTMPKYSKTPRWLRPRLDAGQQRDLGLAHVLNLDTIAKGQGNADILYQWAGGVFTWSRVAELLQVGAPEMAAQLELATTMVNRFTRTGRVIFTGPEYQLAKTGVEVMDQLAAIVDRQTAIIAAEWSEAKINALAAQNREHAA